MITLPHSSLFFLYMTLFRSDDHVIFFFFEGSGDHRDLPSFPTRRSSDLGHLARLRVVPHGPEEDARAPGCGVGDGRARLGGIEGIGRAADGAAFAHANHPTEGHGP